MSANSAAWIHAPFADLTVGSSPYPIAGASQLIVRVRALAVNPLDSTVQSVGRLMYRWLEYPVVLGEDVAGEVVAVGARVTRFQPGDRIVAYAVGMEKGRDHVAEGGFQSYVLVEERLAAPIPNSMRFEDAVVLPLAVSTAAAALFQKDQLALAHPSSSPRKRAEAVVIWGGATSVGSNAVQLAHAAGYSVITTASPKNHDRMRELGAEHVFDYRDPDVVRRVVSAGKSSISGVVAIATGSAEPSVAIAIAAGAKRVALTSPSVSFYDQPRRPGLSRARAAMIGRLVAGNVRVQSRCMLHGVRAKFVWGSTIMDNEVGAMLWTHHLPRALADGSHMPSPPPLVVGAGLDRIQAALDTMRAGVAHQKLVVTLE